MNRKPKMRWSRALTRPLIYKLFTRLGVALLCVAALNRVRQAQGYASVWALGCMLLAGLFLAGAWLVHLRRDGTRIPRMKSLRFFHKKKPERAYGDMIDYVDEEIVDFDDLDDDEKDLVSMAVNLLCALVLLICSFLPL